MKTHVWLGRSLMFVSTVGLVTLVGIRINVEDAESGALAEPVAIPVATAEAQSPPRSDRPDGPVERRPGPGAASTSCERPLPVWENGRRTGAVCPADAGQRGLTVLDLSDQWAPSLFAEDSSLGARGRQPYRDIYLALADEQQTTPQGVRVDFGRHLELYGIFPNFRVLRERLRDRERLDCHAAVDGEGLAHLRAPLRPAHMGNAQRRQARQVESQKAQLEAAAAERGLASIEELRDDRRLGPVLERYQRDRHPIEGIAAIQDHLICDGYLSSRHPRGVLEYGTMGALREWQRMHMIISNGTIDEATLAAVRADHRDLVFHQALRTLRERVVDATGLIEDGTAIGAFGTILGRTLDPHELRVMSEREPLENGARDYISPATEAAARALGWTSADALQSYLDRLPEGALGRLRVAVRLPPPPPWHSAHMNLSATIDRGDIWFDNGYRAAMRRGEPPAVRPSIVVSVEHQGRTIPLLRWNTTIGGWQEELLASGDMVMKYKESPAGSRFWRDVIASPAWLPPASTPDSDLVRARPNGSYRSNQRVLGPGYASAYGLVMMILHKGRERNDGTPLEPIDEGIRTHGSVSYRSILSGSSHGCHRLFNHLAVRLGDFLIRHRNHERQGPIAASYERFVTRGDQTFEFGVTSRGYGYTLTPPVPVEVLEGNIRSRRRTAPVRAIPIRRPEAEEGAEIASAP